MSQHGSIRCLYAGSVRESKILTQVQLGWEGGNGDVLRLIEFTK